VAAAGTDQVLLRFAPAASASGRPRMTPQALLEAVVGGRGTALLLPPSGSRPAMAEAGTAPGQNADCRCHEQAELSSAENRASLASALGRNEPPSWREHQRRKRLLPDKGSRGGHPPSRDCSVAIAIVHRSPPEVTKALVKV
jgi:hypothetical protein